MDSCVFFTTLKSTISNSSYYIAGTIKSTFCTPLLIDQCNIFHVYNLIPYRTHVYVCISLYVKVYPASCVNFEDHSI